MADQINKYVGLQFQTNADQVKDSVNGLMTTLDKTSSEYEDLEKALRDVASAEQALINSENKLNSELGHTKGAISSIEAEVRKATAAYQNKVIELDKVKTKYSDVNTSSQVLNKSTTTLTSSVSSNGGAMGLLNELTGGLAMTFKDAGEATEIFGNKLTGIKGALLATGIGALVIVVGLLIENWDKVSEAISNTSSEAKALESINKDLTKGMTDLYTELFKVETAFNQAKSGAISKEEALQVYNETLGDSIGKANTLEEAEKLYASKTADYVKATQLRMTAQLLLAKAAEESAKIATGEAATVSLTDKLSNIWNYYTKGVEKDLTDLSKDNIKRTEDDIKTLLDLAKKAEKEANEIDKKANIRSVKKIELAKKEKTPEEIAAEKALKAREKEIAEMQKQSELLLKYKKENDNKIIKQNEDFLKKVGQQGSDDIKRQQEQAAKNKEMEAIRYQEMIADYSNATLTLSQIFSEHTALNNALEAASFEISKLYADGKIYLMESTAAAASIASAAAGKETEIGKGLAIAATTINTYSAISGQLKAFAGVPIPGYAVAQAVATGAFGLLQVKKILDVKVPNTNGSSGSVPSATISSASAAPNVSFVASNENQLATTIGNQNRQQAPVRAYVVSSDVTTAQSLDRNLIDSSTI